MAEHLNLFGGPLPRRCRGCGETLPVEAFPVDVSRPDGRGYVCRGCRRISPPDIPNHIERSEARRNGQAWCRVCASWHRVEDTTKQGLCREHQREEDRRRYAADHDFRRRRREHAARHARGVDLVPIDGGEYLLELFEGCCAYCPTEATTWDHVIAVSKGGTTEPGNIVPACRSCNSSKRDRDLDTWLDATGREISLVAVEHLSLHGVVDV